MGTREIKANGGTRYEDHPHAYGDKTTAVMLILAVPGSSPRVWGQGIIADIQFRPPGIIPTRMGTSNAITLFGQGY